MAEVLFYHLTDHPLERTLPELLQRCLAREWRVIVRAGGPAAVARLDGLLWTYDAASFLPHGTDDGAAQPVYLTAGGENPNGARVLMLVEGARVDPEEAAALDRACLLFDGHAPDALAAAREDWRRVKGAGLPARYWAREGGRWVEKARA